MRYQKQERVFVVDDELIIAKTVALILEKNGFSTRFFIDPLVALHASKSDVPDLLVSDVCMPQLSGIDLAIQIKASYPACKILLFSGQADTVNLLQTARQQGHEFHLLAKPVHPSTLLQQVRQSLHLNPSAFS